MTYTPPPAPRPIDQPVYIVEQSAIGQIVVGAVSGVVAYFLIQALHGKRRR